MSQEFDFEKHYDVLLTSTDLTSTLIAAASARVGKRILHLDPFDHYGQLWSSLKLFDLLRLEFGRFCYPQSKPIYGGQDEATSPATVVHCKPTQLISNVQLLGHIFDDLDQCRSFVRQCVPTIAEDTIEKFYQEFNPKLRDQSRSIDELNQMFCDLCNHESSDLNRLNNSFLLDLTPRFLHTMSEMVDVLRRSRISEYLNYRKLSRILTPVIESKASAKKDQVCSLPSITLINVPFTKADVFQSANLSLIEKRLFMKFSQFIQNYQKAPESFAQFDTMRFDQCMSQHGLPVKIRDLICNSVLMQSPEQLSTKQAIDRIGRCLTAVNRFGSNRPYLLHEYGTEDIVQAFARNCAVYGGTYCLQSLVKSFTLADSLDRCDSVQFTHQDRQYSVKCDFLITNYDIYTLCDRKEMDETPRKMISRAIACSRKSICADGLAEYNNSSLLYLPPSITGTQNCVMVFESDCATNSCPSGFYIQHFWCDSSNTSNSTATEELMPVVEMVFAARSNSSQIAQDEKEECKPLWCLYFNQRCDIPTYHYHCSTYNLPSNLFLVDPPQNELDFDFTLRQARDIFHKMYPNEEFFPKTDDPNEQTMMEEEEEEDGNKVQKEKIENIKEEKENENHEAKDYTKSDIRNDETGDQFKQLPM